MERREFIKTIATAAAIAALPASASASTAGENERTDNKGTGKMKVLLVTEQKRMHFHGIKRNCRSIAKRRD